MSGRFIVSIPIVEQRGASRIEFPGGDHVICTSVVFYDSLKMGEIPKLHRGRGRNRSSALRDWASRSEQVRRWCRKYLDVGAMTPLEAKEWSRRIGLVRSKRSLSVNP